MRDALRLATLLPSAKVAPTLRAPEAPLDTGR